jgi:hypothetical protein
MINEVTTGLLFPLEKVQERMRKPLICPPVAYSESRRERKFIWRKYLISNSGKIK